MKRRIRAAGPGTSKADHGSARTGAVPTTVPRHAGWLTCRPRPSRTKLRTSLVYPVSVYHVPSPSLRSDCPSSIRTVPPKPISSITCCSSIDRGRRSSGIDLPVQTDRRPHRAGGPHFWDQPCPEPVPLFRRNCSRNTYGHQPNRLPWLVAFLGYFPIPFSRFWNRRRLRRLGRRAAGSRPLRDCLSDQKNIGLERDVGRIDKSDGGLGALDDLDRPPAEFVEGGGELGAAVAAAGESLPSRRRGTWRSQG